MVWPFRKRPAPWSPPALGDALALARSAGAEAVDAIPNLAPALGYQDGALNLVYPVEVMEELDAALDDLVRRMTPGDIIRIGQHLRAAGPGWRGEPQQDRCWSRLYIEHFSKVVTGTPHDFARLAILSAHASGHLRERALHELDRAHGDDALPFLLACCVDWVAEVQQVAWAAVRRRLVPASAPRFVASLPLVLRLLDFRRVHCAPLVTEVLDFLSNQPGVLEGGLEHPLLSVRHATWDTMGDREMLNTQHALQAVRDPALTRKAGRYLEERAVAGSASHQQSIVNALSESPAPELRLSSLLLAERCGLPDVTERHRCATLDRARSVRQHARYHLREAGVDVDHRRVYLDALPRSLGAIAGLGEVGTPDDWEVLVESLESASRLACEAIHVMRVLNARESREMRMFMVADSRTKVSGTAVASLDREVHGADEATIRTYLASPLVHVRRGAIRLASKLPGWRAAALIAPSIASDTQKAAALALTRWRPRPNPSDEEFEAWRAWMRAVGIDERERRERVRSVRWRFGIDA